MYDIACNAFAKTLPLTLRELRCAAEGPIASVAGLTAERVSEYALYTAHNYLNLQRKRGLLSKHPSETHAYFLAAMPEFA